ncbi:hypothetical protein HMPREF0290_2017 [Corynebacterium efficiens YS-314]|uniref:DUF4921 domain-containing protein n=1 Tax=Corynebacterium efficiens (strain DSM 44549 / YS-314 / AJ 12310 / JCM 11189 / NBRC 100395) TaxID=196164 RepID=Q8FP08_COREF|nr:DUF4921 family protein [Corynebacterium efficiens]EEW49330.1 hypothetical protein HMPREF0290_2017 [Corynebacterium efficiens YS-314]BAC18795.1 hypothetical protein [Corynebacterium efficiens YS-314]
MNSPFRIQPTPIRTMADGTIKQVHPFTGTEVWTVPGRGNRPLSRPAPDPVPLSPEDHTSYCAFCPDNQLSTPPEKSRMVRTGKGDFEVLAGGLPRDLDKTVAEFRRVPNLFEIVTYEYWNKNFGFEMDPETAMRMATYLADPEGRRHVLSIVRTRMKAAGEDGSSLTEAELLERAPSYFSGGHDVIIARRHFTDDATDDSQLASSGTLTSDEHAAFIRFTLDGMRDLYARNRYAPYVVAFQNWLKPAGASFDHLHKQLVAIDERGYQNDVELAQLRHNPNMYNEWGVDYAGYHNLIIAENDHAVAFAGFGHRYPTLEIYSRSPVSEPWLQSGEEVRAMSDLIHACHAATGPDVPCNEEWHHKPVDVDMPMPWRVTIKWRVSTLAGFEGGTKIYLNTLSPQNVRDRVVRELYRLRDEGWIDEEMRIATECSVQRNSLRYNPLLQR